MKKMNWLPRPDQAGYFLWLPLLGFLLFVSPRRARAQTFRVNISPALHQASLDGRLLLLLANNNKEEPRFQISDAAGTQMVFGADVNDWQPGHSELVDMHAFGYPIERLKEVPAGDYYVQIDQVIPPIAEPKDTRYIKHIKIQSKQLSEFWGRPMFIGAHILLPEGFDEHPDVTYPLAVFHGHHPPDFDGFRLTQPDEGLKPDTNARFRISGYNRIVQQEAYDFYKQWTGPGFPRVLAIEIEHANRIMMIATQSILNVWVHTAMPSPMS